MSLQLGSTGSDVTKMERQLIAAGYDCTASGNFDAEAQTAVRNFQTNQNLVVDGIFGPITQSELQTFLKQKWQAYAGDQVGRSNLPGAALSDGKMFAPQFNNLGTDARVQFWSKLVIAMMEYESGYDPGDVYREDFGVDSIGLLQLSYVDQANYGIHMGWSEQGHQLEDPQNNIRFGILIMAQLVQRDHCLSQCVNGQWKGISAYWGTMRSDAKHLNAYNGIKSALNATVFQA